VGSVDAARVALAVRMKLRRVFCMGKTSVESVRW
jgi:hypothetical protein